MHLFYCNSIAIASLLRAVRPGGTENGMKPPTPICEQAVVERGGVTAAVILFFQLRLLCLSALALTIAAGLLSRAWPLAWYWWDKSLGDARYALAVYLALRILFPRRRVITAATAAVGFCLGIESFKFTGLSADWSG